MQSYVHLITRLDLHVVVKATLNELRSALELYPIIISLLPIAVHLSRIRDTRL